MLFIAMITTVAAVSLAFFSPIRAQRSLGLVIVLGIVLDWLVTRFLLEEFYLGRRLVLNKADVSPIQVLPRFSTGLWPAALLLLVSVALIAPPGVEVLDIEQFLPADDVELDELRDLQSRYILASSTIAWLVVDVDGDSTEDLQAVLNLQRQIGNHPSVINLDTGVVRRPMVIGLPFDSGTVESSTIDGLPSGESASLFLQDARLRRDGVTSGVAIGILLDSQDADAALQFQSDFESLLIENGLSGDMGGELVTGASLARDFDQSRVLQIAGAGIAVLIVSLLVVRSPARAVRIAVGAVAVGLAVDGIASLGGRGVETAPAVLLGMGFAADYLSHASAPHAPTRRDTSARWLAAASSISVFLLLGLANFPPARNTGRLLSISILISVILATCLAFQQPDPVGDDRDTVSPKLPSGRPYSGPGPLLTSPDLKEE
jgi:predicted RND superfamily exporter protein